jgi:hypothetical protein
MTRTRTIHKFLIARETGAIQLINVPGYLEFLDVQVQKEVFVDLRHQIVMWCAVLEGDSQGCELEVSVVGTGHPLPDDLSLRSYKRTVQDALGLVWHIFVREGKVT